MVRLYVLCVLAALCLTGCSTTEGKMSADEKANFKGGPPPPEAQAEMQKWMARSAERAKAEGAKPPQGASSQKP